MGGQSWILLSRLSNNFIRTQATSSRAAAMEGEMIDSILTFLINLEMKFEAFTPREWTAFLALVFLSFASLVLAESAKTWKH